MRELDLKKKLNHVIHVKGKRITPKMIQGMAYFAKNVCATWTLEFWKLQLGTLPNEILYMIGGVISEDQLYFLVYLEEMMGVHGLGIIYPDEMYNQARKALWSGSLQDAYYRISKDIRDWWKRRFPREDLMGLYYLIGRSPLGDKYVPTRRLMRRNFATGKYAVAPDKTHPWLANRYT